MRHYFHRHRPNIAAMNFTKVMRAIFLCLLSYQSLSAQSDSTSTKIYKTYPKYEMPIPAAFFCGAYFGFKALDRYASLTEADVKKLNPESINSFDRPVAYYNPSELASAQHTSDVFLDVAVSSPALLFIDKKIRKDWKDFISLFLTAHTIDNTIYFSSVLSVRRPRPLTYNPAVPIEQKIGDGKSNSFFSGHTSWSATSTFLMAKIYTDYHQVKGIKRVLIFTGALIPPSLVGYYRMEAGKHFKTDVLTGLVVGAACGWTIPELHRIKSKNKNLSIHPFTLNGANGVTFTYLVN